MVVFGSSKRYFDAYHAGDSDNEGSARLLTQCLQYENGTP